MDYEHVFDEMEVLTQPFALCELHGNCTLGLKGQAGATLHYILAGRGEISLRGQPSMALERGTIVLIPSFQAHTLRSYGDPGQPLPTCHPTELRLASHLVKSEQPSTGGVLMAICSHINISIRGTNGLVNLIRQPIVAQIAEDSLLENAVHQILQELSAPTLGGRSMVRALLLQCSIQLLRNRLLANDRGLVWMAALRDEKLWGTLRYMLEKPGDAHTVESLADIAAMSRSSYAARFSAAYGHGPMALLRELRMQLASNLLCQSDLPVKRIARLSGFHSRSAFTRTFTKTLGQSPQAFRSALK